MSQLQIPRYAKQVIVLFNGHLPQLAVDEPLRSFLESNATRAAVRLLVPGEWAVEYFRREGVAFPRHTAVDENVSRLPTCVLTAHAGSFTIDFVSQLVKGNDLEARTAWRSAARMCARSHRIRG